MRLKNKQKINKTLLALTHSQKRSIFSSTTKINLNLSLAKKYALCRNDLVFRNTFDSKFKRRH